MEKLSLKEKMVFSFIFNERRVYQHWYTRFLISGVDLERIRRVVARIKNWYEWCSEWSKEGESLENLADDSLSKGNTYTARWLFHEAAGCFHIGEHFFYIDHRQKNESQEKVRVNYRKALDLYGEQKKPVRIEIPFRKTVIPGYLRIAEQRKRPLILLINGMDNLKEVENHYLGNLLSDAGFNVYTFDGPGQGEMWKNMKFISDYEKAVTAIIDWFNENDKYNINFARIGTVGFSLGGYLAPRAAAFDKRICCAVGNGGPAHLRGFSNEKKVNPILLKGLPYLTGTKNYKESLEQLDIDIKTAPPIDRPLLIFHSGKDRLIPNGREHADYFMEWAVGEKELKYYPDGEHICANYLDEVLPYTIDWLRKHLMK
jgi:alpha-beta hydrolase superfamily lysophospholipase